MAGGASIWRAGMQQNVMTIRNLLMGSAIWIVLLGLLGLGVDSVAAIPNDAPVLINTATKTFIAQPCIDADPIAAYFVGTRARLLRRYGLSTVAEAKRLKYRLDDVCHAIESLGGTKQSLTTLMLTKLGILSKPREWWDAKLPGTEPENAR
jgi:hypothetical protein